MIFETQDGSHSIFSEKYGVSYHSKYGAIQETEHVFINAGLRLKAVEQSEITILEIGFGTGLNAFVTYLEAQKRGLTIYYTGVEAYPISLQTAQTLNYAEQLQAQGEQEAFEKMHTTASGEIVELNEDFYFQKLLTSFEELDFQGVFDIIYFDAFAPTAQPELWEEPLLQKMYNALKPNGVFVTYCAKGQFKRNLRAVGFTVQALAGPIGKREMTRGIKIVKND